MDFGKLHNVDGVDFTLPEDDPETTRLLARWADAAPRVRYGTPAWGDRGYVEKIYPRGTKPGDFLYHYARQFSAVELNSTYYGVSTDSIAKWVDVTPESFRFCPKFPGSISHEAELRDVAAATDTFLDQLTLFGDRLGLPWLVLPPTFAPDRLGVLRDFVAYTAERGRIAIELRHPAWFEGARGAVFELFERYGVVAVITDVAGRRDVLHQRLTTATVMLRFVGNGLHPSDLTRLNAWAERIAKWCSAGITAFVFLHQPTDHLNVELAEHFVPRLNALAGLDLMVPKRVPKHEQGMLF